MNKCKHPKNSCRNRKYDSKRQNVTFILSCKKKKHKDQTQYKNQGLLRAGIDLFSCLSCPFIRKTSWQRFLSYFLDCFDRIAGTITRLCHSINCYCVKQIISCYRFRAIYSSQIYNCADRYHLSQIIFYKNVIKCRRVGTIRNISLHYDAIKLSKAIEIRCKAASIISLQCLQQITDRNT